MKATKLASATLLSLSFVMAPVVQAETTSTSSGVVKVRSAYPVDETIRRIKADIAKKGILFFSEIDQAQLAASAGIKLDRSTLLVFGNPPLGVQFITAKPEAGLDWPVRVLVQQDANGDVWAVYSDFAWIAKRHGITNRDEQFRTASGVVESITSTIRPQP